MQVNTESGCFSGHPALRDLALIYSVLDLPTPGPEDGVEDVFATVLHRLQEVVRGGGKETLLSEPMLRLGLTLEQWNKFEQVRSCHCCPPTIHIILFLEELILCCSDSLLLQVCHIMNDEYSIRFKTLVKRVDLTLTSFKWGKNKVSNFVDY